MAVGHAEGIEDGLEFEVTLAERREPRHVTVRGRKCRPPGG